MARPQRRQGLGHLRRRPPVHPGREQLVGLAEATPAGYKEKGRFEIADKGLPSWAHPVVSGGRLYVRNQDTLLVYDIKAAAR